MVMRYTQKGFNGTYEPTIGVEFAGRTVDLNGKSLKVQIWDTVTKYNKRKTNLPVGRPRGI